MIFRLNKPLICGILCVLQVFQINFVLVTVEILLKTSFSYSFYNFSVQVH